MQALLDTLVQYSKLVGGVAVLLIAIGLLVRRNSRAHIPLMVAAFVVDLVNLLVVEFARDAVQKTLAGGHDWLFNLHVWASFVFLVNYVVAMVTGTLLLKRGRCRRLHRWNAALFIVCRLTNFVTSFWM